MKNKKESLMPSKKSGRKCKATLSSLPKGQVGLYMTSSPRGFTVWRDDTNQWILDASTIMDKGHFFYNPKMFRDWGLNYPTYKEMYCKLNIRPLKLHKRRKKL